MKQEDLRPHVLAVIRKCPNKFAVKYAQALLQLMNKGAEDKTIDIQLLYVLSNTQHWRGLEAQKVKRALNQFGEDLAHEGR